jgi:hypothetical protein
MAHQQDDGGAPEPEVIADVEYVDDRDPADKLEDVVEEFSEGLDRMRGTIGPF